MTASGIVRAVDVREMPPNDLSSGVFHLSSLSSSRGLALLTSSVTVIIAGFCPFWKVLDFLPDFSGFFFWKVLSSVFSTKDFHENTPF